MSVSVRIVDGALGAAGECEALRAGEGVDGAVVVFEGIVRGEEEGRAIRGLLYEAYEPMAGRMLRELGEAMVREHGVRAIDVEHSRGEVAVGACSFRLTVCSAHRAGALRAMDAFIDRMKRDVPIWKTAVWG